LGDEPDSDNAVKVKPMTAIGFPKILNDKEFSGLAIAAQYNCANYHQVYQSFEIARSDYPDFPDYSRQMRSVSA
jgi:hypothetical protein